jgi:hypothetical protein
VNGVAWVFTASVCAVPSRILAGIFVIPIQVVGSVSGVQSGGHLQPCVPSRDFRAGPSFLLFAPGIKFA